jgi:hypothetical protein
MQERGKTTKNNQKQPIGCFYTTQNKLNGNGNRNWNVDVYSGCLGEF